MTELPRLTYTISEAAQIIPCNEAWLTDQLRAGRFTGRKVHRQWRLSLADLNAIVEACRVDTEVAEDPRQRGLCAQSRKTLKPDG